MVARGPIDPSPKGEKSEIPMPSSRATSDAFVAPEMSSDVDPAHVYSRDIDPEPTYEDAADSLSREDKARPFMEARANFRRLSIMLMQKAAMETFVSEYSNAGDETMFEPAPHFEASLLHPGIAARSTGSEARKPVPVRAAAATVPTMSADPKDGKPPAREVPVVSTTADARVVELQHELQMSRMKSDMAMLAARYEDTLNRRELETRLETQALLAQAKFDAQQQLFASQQAAEAKAKAQQEANQDGLQALAARLDKPREARPIKDITSDAIVKCPIDKGRSEMTEWAMALASAASGLCEPASEMIAMVMARESSVIEFARQPENVQADRWLARQINASIKEDTEAGKLFHKEARKDVDLCRSGVKLLDKVYKTVTKTNPLKLDLAEQKMASTVYFTGGMTIDQTKLAAALFKSDHAELGSRRSQDELAVYKAMLKELPPALHEPQSTVVRDLLWEMEESTMNSEPLIEYDKLVTKMAIMLRNVQGAAKKVKEASSTTLTFASAAKGGKGKGKGAAKGEPGRSPWPMRRTKRRRRRTRSTKRSPRSRCPWSRSSTIP